MMSSHDGSRPLGDRVPQMMSKIEASHEEIAAANAYEEFFVDGIFREWSSRVVRAARLRPGSAVLDVACGTGVLAREALSAVGPNGRLTGIDPAAGMLAVAGRLEPSIEWRQGVAESLPFPDRSFDAVVSQFGLMFFKNRTQAVAEMLRVLKPGGRVTVAVWNSVDSMPAWAAEIDLLHRLAGQAAADALRAPFVLGDVDEVVGLFEEAGADSPSPATERSPAYFPSIRVMVEADLRGWLPVFGVELPEDRIQLILEEAEEALAPYRSSDGRVEFESSAHIVTGERNS